MARSAGTSGTRSGPAPRKRAALRHDGAAVEYEIVRSARRRKTLEISLDKGRVRVAVPLRTPLREIDEFVRQRIPWILKHQHAPTLQPASLAFETGETLPFQGRALTMRVSRRRGARVTVDADLFDLRVGVPTRLDGDARRDAIERALFAWYTARAQEALESSVAAWARVVRRWPRRVLVRNQRRRWGSCGPDGTLRFNWRLVMFEPALLDYVVVHELSHLQVPHHGPSFWRTVDRAMPDHLERRKRLREAAALLPPL